MGFGSLIRLSLVLCVSFVDHCLSVCPLSFDHCVVCPSMYELVLPVGINKLFLVLTYNMIPPLNILFV